MRKFIIAAVVSFGLLLTACSQVTAGEVYKKEYEPERDWSTQEPDYQYICQPGVRYVNGQPQSYQDCKNRFVGYKTVHHHEDECYRLYFKNEDGDEGDNCVDPQTYDDINVGDWYDEEGDF